MVKKQVLQENIGKRVKFLREKKKITQKDLAYDCNIEESNFSRIESGRTNPTIYTLAVIAENLGVTLQELVGVGL